MLIRTHIHTVLPYASQEQQWKLITNILVLLLITEPLLKFLTVLCSQNGLTVMCWKKWQLTPHQRKMKTSMLERRCYRMPISDRCVKNYPLQNDYKENFLEEYWRGQMECAVEGLFFMCLGSRRLPFSVQGRSRHRLMACYWGLQRHNKSVLNKLLSLWIKHTLKCIPFYKC